MPQVKLELSNFLARKDKLLKAAGHPLVLILGNSSDFEKMTITSSLFSYLFGYEFPNTIIILDSKTKIFTGKKKSEILSSVPDCETFILNKDMSNLDEMIKIISMQYSKLAVVGDLSAGGELSKKVLADMMTVDAYTNILNIFAVKEADEVENCKKAGLVVSHLIQNGTELIKDGKLDIAAIEDMLCRDIDGLNNDNIEFAYPPEIINYSFKIGIKYCGYCAEGSRTVFSDLNILYNAQKYILGLIKPGSSSKMIYNKCQEYFKNNDLAIHKDFLYTAGLMPKEKSFEEGFTVQNGVVFVVSLKSSPEIDTGMALTNTFVLQDRPIFLTPEDKSEDFLDNRPRFRDKKKEHELDIRRKEHQKELFDKLIAEQLAFYKNKGKKQEGSDEGENTRPYLKESQIPRKGGVVVDHKAQAVVIPIGEYAVPFHVSLIKSAVVVSENILKINFGVEKKTVKPTETENQKLSLIKTINITTGEARFLNDQIQELKINYSASSDKDLVKQDKLIEKPKKVSLEGVFLRTDVKTTQRKKKTGSLELHENGFRFSEDKIDILFSNVRHAYFIRGNIQDKTILHFHLWSPILVNNKKTKNIQLYQEAGTNITYNTQRRGDEQMEYIIEKEEEERQRRLNRDFEVFVNLIESETSLKVQVPKDGFTGVHAREAVIFQQTHESIVSLFEQPFFVLSLDDVEIVNFERVVYNVKTADVVFVLKDKTLPPAKILSIETSYMSKLKDYLDSNNIVYMETVFNIQWKAVLNEILQDPISFYESGGWAELMTEDTAEDDKAEEESEIEESEEEEIETSEEESSDNTTFDNSDDVVSDSVDSSDDEDDDSDTESSEEQTKRRRR
ncbi:FACT complex subunit SPT16 [Nosema bombycis CQ1]|uniref:FACT complex subunit n=1 Tax=Nosema bombycis (strain CQ1 / CVCC 102059) TaxID=578461 RepID=R0MKM0_NOSB1|nr:FACT complex subunit SPT16 [Nosema bombycis CQ1]|eukprot:EOB14785.1 FACT complex subunit SPT16 [Nosema bombycis CQ1]